MFGGIRKMTMPVFDVTVSRYHLASLIIEANAPQEAKKLAWDKLGEALEDDTLWDPEDYDVVSADPIPENLLKPPF
jgi:hypothetical protein